MELAASPLFQSYFELVENVGDFLQKPALSFTRFQRDLYRNGRLFKHIYKENPPENLKAQELIDWYHRTMNAKNAKANKERKNAKQEIAKMGSSSLH